MKAIQEWKRLPAQKGLKSFLGLANYYCHFIRDFSKIIRPLSDLLKKGASQEWGELCHQTFEELKSKFSLLHEFGKPFEVHTDANDFAIGGVLMKDGRPLHMRAKS